MTAEGHRDLSATDALRLAAQYAHAGGPTFRQRLRLARFRARNPEITIRREFGEWLAGLPEGERYEAGCVHARTFDKLLDRLKEHLGPSG